MKSRKLINFFKVTLFLLWGWLGVYPSAFSASTPLSDMEKNLKAIETRLAAIEGQQESILEKEDKILEEIQVLKIRIHRS